MMLKKFTVENFKAFQGRLELDLTPSDYEFNTEAINSLERVISKGLIYGFNGCGKSVLGLALLDIMTHLTDKSRTVNDYFPYLNLKNTSMHSVLFEYEFVFLNSTVVYRYRKAGLDNLLEESLLIDGHEVISYDYQQHKGKVTLAGAENLNFHQASEAVHPISRVKYVNSNTILSDNHENQVFKAFISFVENMLMFYSLGENRYMGFRSGVERIDTAIIKAGKIKDFELFLTEANIDMPLLAGEQNGEQVLLVKYGKKAVNFYTIASTGTKSLALFYYWFMQMEKASFVYMDEFDAFYHFELAEAIVKRLKDFDKTQILMTTHNTDLLSNDILRPDCYYWLNNGIVKPFNRLTDKELRQAHNLQKMYKAGAFDGR